MFSNQRKQNIMLWYSLCHHSGWSTIRVNTVRKVRNKKYPLKVKGSQGILGSLKKMKVCLKRSGNDKC